MGRSAVEFDTACRPIIHFPFLHRRKHRHVRLGITAIVIVLGLQPAWSHEPVEWNDTTYQVLLPAAETDGRDFTVDGGNAVFVPRGSQHSYRVESEEGADMLTIVVPGGLERFFEEMATEALVIPNDMPRITEIAEEFHLEFTGPPLAE